MTDATEANVEKIERPKEWPDLPEDTCLAMDILEEKKCKVYIACKHCGFKLVAHGLAWKTFVKETPGKFVCPCERQMSINIVQTKTNFSEVG